MLRRLTLTPALRAAIDSVERAEAAYVPGRMLSGFVEIPKLGLADAVMAALAAQAAGCRAQLAQLPKAKAAQVPIVEIELRRKRSRRRA